MLILAEVFGYSEGLRRIGAGDSGRGLGVRCSSATRVFGVASVTIALFGSVAVACVSSVVAWIEV